MNTQVMSVQFDHAEFEIESFEEAHTLIRINPAMGIEAIAQTARDLVYATHGRATMYLDSIQDIADWIASSGYMPRIRLGEWHKSEFGFTLCAMVEFASNPDEAIDLWIYALANDDEANYSHTILVGSEFTEFEEALIAAKEEAIQMTALSGAIKFASYTRSRLMRGLPCYAHLAQLYQMIGAIHFRNGLHSHTLRAALEASRLAWRDYENTYYYAHLYSDLEYCVLRDLVEAITYLVEWRKYRI